MKPLALLYRPMPVVLSVAAGPNGGLTGKFAFSGWWMHRNSLPCWENPVKPGSGECSVQKEAAGNATLHHGIHYVDYDFQ